MIRSSEESGVGARLQVGLELPHHPRFHVLIAFDTGRPSSNIRFRALQASNASALFGWTREFMPEESGMSLGHDQHLVRTQLRPVRSMHQRLSVTTILAQSGDC